MNFYTIAILGYIIVAGLLIYFIARDSRRTELFFGRHKILAWLFGGILILGIAAAVDIRFVEPNILTTTIVNFQNEKIINPIKIAFVSDPQLGANKKTAWAEKIAKKIEEIKPDIVLLGGDLIDNEWTFEDESRYLEPLGKLSEKYKIYAVLGNHEYGLATSNQYNPLLGTGNRSALVIDRLNKIGIQLLRNDLACEKIKKIDICIYGIDDIWGGPISFDNLKKWDAKSFLIYLTHNPDGVLYWPNDSPNPNLILAGHTHKGQLYLPFLGPLGDSELDLGRDYNYGKKTWRSAPMYISSGAGESGGPIRFFAWPEVVEINVESKNK